MNFLDYLIYILKIMGTIAGIIFLFSIIINIIRQEKIERMKYNASKQLIDQALNEAFKKEE